MQFNSSSIADYPLLRIGPFGGIDLSTNQAQISLNRSPDMLNFFINANGDLNKRTGFEKVFATSLGPGQINGTYEYKKTIGATYFLIAHSTKLYTQSGSDQPVEIYSGLANNPVNFFTMNDKCYIMDGTNYLVFDGSSVVPVIPYIPTVSISKDPAGGGTQDEDLNLLGAGFKDSFSADGVAKDFILTYKGLDATPLTADVNGTLMNEGAGFTVDRANGKVTFTTAPLKGTNNVIITAYKTIAGFADRIKKCRFHTIFGGSNDTRVFVSGNPDMPDYVWRLGLYDPTYAPENGMYKYPEKVKGFSKQYDYLVIHREGGLHQITFELVNGEPSFPSKPINDQVGTYAGKSIQIIENNPVFLSKRGVYMLNASNVRDERNVSHLSANVDPRLLRESNLENALSIDFDKKYWLAVNGNVYIFDYVINEWYLYDNINASCFIEKDGVLYFGSSVDGMVYRFKDESNPLAFEDDGQEINAYWLSKLIDFGRPEFRKIVQNVFLDIKPNKHTSLNLYGRSDRKGETFILNTRMDQLDFFFIDFNRFAFITSDIPQEVGKKIKMKKITHFQLKIENNAIDEGLGLIGISIKFGIQNEVK